MSIKVIVEIMGGVIVNAQIPEGVQLIIRDYDWTEATDPKQDENGNEYVESVWTSIEDTEIEKE